MTLDSLCGNKYYRNDLTAIKFIQAMKILSKWRNFKNINKKQKEAKAVQEVMANDGKENSKIPHSAPLKNASDEVDAEAEKAHQRMERLQNIAR